ncbi:MAG: hypothetical protein H0W07_07330 [Chloroflexi bacterium]|nr:hypothetical protein [Chloroflexota bacterium]
MIDRIRRALQPEDLLLAAVLVVLPLLGGDAAEPAPSFFDDRVDVFGGLVAILAAVGAIVCMATRAPGESPLDPARSPVSGARGPVDLDGRMALIGPYIGGVALVGGQGFEKLGIRGGDWLAGPAFIVCIGAVVLADRLPVVRSELRRMLVTPFVLVAGGIFEGFVGDITRGLDLAAVLGELTSGVPVAGVAGDVPTLGLALFVYGMVLAGTAVFYTMLIYAPRELAATEPERGRWLIRFGLFALVLIVGLLLRPSAA